MTEYTMPDRIDFFRNYALSDNAEFAGIGVKGLIDIFESATQGERESILKNLYEVWQKDNRAFLFVIEARLSWSMGIAGKIVDPFIDRFSDLDEKQKDTAFFVAGIALNHGYKSARRFLIARLDSDNHDERRKAGDALAQSHDCADALSLLLPRYETAQRECKKYLAEAAAKERESRERWISQRHMHLQKLSEWEATASSWANTIYARGVASIPYAYWAPSIIRLVKNCDTRQIKTVMLERITRLENMKIPYAVGPDSDYRWRAGYLTVDLTAVRQRAQGALEDRGRIFRIIGKIFSYVQG